MGGGMDTRRGVECLKPPHSAPSLPVAGLGCADFVGGFAIHQGVDMSAVPKSPAANDPDFLETKEWLDALEAVLEREGPERAHYLLERMIEKARRAGTFLPFSANTAYINTIPAQLEEKSPGDYALEARIRAYTRWNAMVM